MPIVYQILLYILRTLSISVSTRHLTLLTVLAGMPRRFATSFTESLSAQTPRRGFAVAVNEETPDERREVRPELPLRGIVCAGPQDVDEFHEHVLHGVVRVGVGDARREKAHKVVDHGPVYVDEAGPGGVIDAAPGLSERLQERHRRLRIAPAVSSLVLQSSSLPIAKNQKLETRNQKLTTSH